MSPFHTRSRLSNGSTNSTAMRNVLARSTPCSSETDGRKATIRTCSVSDFLCGPSVCGGETAQESHDLGRRDVVAPSREIVRTVDRPGTTDRGDASRREGGPFMKAEATCHGAGTIVNAIATGQGGAFGLALRATATAEIRPGAFGVQARVAADVDPVLAVSVARRILDRANRDIGLELVIDSEIP